MRAPVVCCQPAQKATQRVLGENIEPATSVNRAMVKPLENTMQSKLAAGLVVVCGCLTQNACGPDKTSSTSGNEVADAMCRYLIRCQATRGRVFSSQEGCTTFYRGVLASGQVESNGANVSACVQVIDQSACNEDASSSTPPACVGVFSSGSSGSSGSSVSVASQIGQSCLAHYSCVEGAYCDDSGYLASVDVCPVCRAQLANGGTCSYSGECASDYCDSTHACAAKLAGGAVCTASSQCASQYCDSATHQCADGQGGAEAPCDSSSACGGNYVCINHVCSDRLLVGSACDGALSECVMDAFCVDGVCASFDLWAKGALDAPCVFSCVDGAYCDYSTTLPGVCKPTVPVNGACTNALQCGTGAHCTSFVNGAGVCTALKNDGVACVVSSECQSDYCNSAGKCAPVDSCTLP